MRLALVVLLAGLVAGCGFGAGSQADSGQATVTVTRDFGHRELAPSQTAAANGTVMRLLQSHFTVKTRYGGGFVQSIDGVSGGGQVDWFYYVNGIEASDGAAAHRLAPGDRVWWDHHAWGAAQRVPAVVGAFPQPFKAEPAQVVCLGTAACKTVEERLGARPGDGIRVLVGTWADVRKDAAARTLEEGPALSGVYAKPGADGFALLDASGKTVRTVTGGLVAATRSGDERPTWIVTGTDEAGVEAAAAALTEDRLRRHFALAVAGGEDLALPL